MSTSAPPPGITVHQYRHWEVVRLASDALQVDVVPGKGGDVVAVRRLPEAVDVLWRSPWGLRERGAGHAVPGHSEAHLMDFYPGGWQTVFPNAGDPVVEHGVAWGMHGEAWLAPHDWEPAGAAAVRLRTRLVRSPFTLEKRIEVSGDRLLVTETARNDGGVRVEVAWGHHVAFGAPFLSGACRLDAGAHTVAVDDVRDVPGGDLAPGARSAWPYSRDRSGAPVDLRVVPGPDRPTARLAYLLDLDPAEARLTNPDLGLTAELAWDRDVFGCLWLWAEMHATAGFPWYGATYVLGLEPHSSHPGQGLQAIRNKTGTQLAFDPGQARTATTSLRVYLADGAAGGG